MFNTLLIAKSFHFSKRHSRFLNNIADTNEPTSVAVKMHRALFHNTVKNNAKLNSDNEPTSISRNLIQRRHETWEGNNMEINTILGERIKYDKQQIDSISLASFNNSNMERFNHFTATNDGANRKNDRVNNQDEGNAQSFSDFVKSVFKCSAGWFCNKKKINEQIESDYPLNLHLRMNEIFSMHDKLCSLCEIFNDLYSAGEDSSLFLDLARKRGKIIHEFEFPFFHTFLISR